MPSSASIGIVWSLLWDCREVTPTYATQLVKMYIFKKQRPKGPSEEQKKWGKKTESTPVLSINWPNFSNEWAYFSLFKKQLNDTPIYLGLCSEWHIMPRAKGIKMFESTKIQIHYLLAHILHIFFSRTASICMRSKRRLTQLTTLMKFCFPGTVICNSTLYYKSRMLVGTVAGGLQVNPGSCNKRCVSALES